MLNFFREVWPILCCLFGQHDWVATSAPHRYGPIEYTVVQCGACGQRFLGDVRNKGMAPDADVRRYKRVLRRMLAEGRG